MRIAITATGPDLEADVDPRFGRCLYFLVVETDDLRRFFGKHAKRFIAAIKTICHAVSLAATESLICIPYLTTMLYLPPERRTTFGVRKNTVRLSIGIEPPEKLIKDIKQALACVAQGVTLNG